MTYPFLMEIVEVYETFATTVQMEPGDVHIQMLLGYDDRHHCINRVRSFCIFGRGSLQDLALAEIIRGDFKGVARTIEDHTLEWLREY
jgi:hypothetical protein